MFVNATLVLVVASCIAGPILTQRYGNRIVSQAADAAPPPAAILASKKQKENPLKRVLLSTLMILFGLAVIAMESRADGHFMPGVMIGPRQNVTINVDVRVDLYAVAPALI